MQAMLLPPHYLNAVVAIGRQVNGVTHWGGTGFFYQRIVTNGGLVQPCLVTNRHVISEETPHRVRVNPLAAGPALEFGLAVVGTEGQPLWTAHPNPNIDIAVTPVNLSAVETAGLDVYLMTDRTDVLTLEAMRKEQVSEGDFVYVLGFPMGEVGGTRSAVIARGGCIARIQDTLAGASSTFLVDASVYPGNSGGPVILRPEMHSVGGSAVDRALLVGIVAAYLPYTDVAVSQQTGQARVVFQENSGLGLVYPVDYIEETFDSMNWKTPEAAVTPVEPSPDLTAEAITDPAVFAPRK